MVKTRTDTHEESCSNRSSNGNELDLAICEMALQLVGIVRHETFVDVVAIAHRGALGDLFVVVATEDAHSSVR